MEPLIAVTGATGYVGGAVTNLLHDQDARLRLVVRDPGRAPAGVGDVAQASFGDQRAATQALAGVDVLFMVSVSESRDQREQHLTFIDAAAAAGVRQVVYTSMIGPAQDATFTFARDHWATEEHLRASGMNWTFLRDSLYLDFLPSMADEHGVIRGPAGEGRVAAVARDDVARSAVSVLGDPAAHAGAAYDLTGPEAMSLSEVAAVITEVTGRSTRYEEQTVEEAYASREPYQVEDWQRDAWVSTYTAIAADEFAVVSADVERLTGTAPMSLAALLRKG